MDHQTELNPNMEKSGLNRGTCTWTSFNPDFAIGMKNRDGKDGCFFGTKKWKHTLYLLFLFYKEKVLSRCLIFYSSRVRGILDGMVELFCVEKMPIFSVEFHFLLQISGFKVVGQGEEKNCISRQPLLHNFWLNRDYALEMKNRDEEDEYFF